LKSSEDCCGGCGPELYTVKRAAKFLDCCERQLRQEMHENKITYRRPPGGVRFTKEDLIERLRPIGGPSASSKSSKARKLLDTKPDNEVTKLTAKLELALPVIKKILQNQSAQSAKVENLLRSCLNGELCTNLADLDFEVATAIIVVIAARAHCGDVESVLRSLLNQKEKPT